MAIVHVNGMRKKGLREGFLGVEQIFRQVLKILICFKITVYPGNYVEHSWAGVRAFALVAGAVLDPDPNSNSFSGWQDKADSAFRCLLR